MKATPKSYVTKVLLNSSSTRKFNDHMPSFSYKSMLWSLVESKGGQDLHQ
jgi:hypothetical protein